MNYFFLYAYLSVISHRVNLNYCTVKEANMKKEYESCLHQVDEKECKAIRHTPVDKGIIKQCQ